ncbi:flagellar hook-associated protein FlgK [Aurantimonas sp. MSK8Z-1]|uniref:flagellar hook-associated protein FlgK n=1 Tax=Mangrovibrevibacter kandeliae TaxID=2968473 RepID=UPI0021193329|nr:flagellar hook-associated protein FlgK [Aurantimonas sp. MSK8Z-1]MCW4113714.1 flagellar hook-associated protein FlgK [Aurantimonas sp. MSK8Z-1]
MSLTSALDSAKSSLAASAAQTAIVSRNVQNVNTPGTTRKYAQVTSTAYGGVQVNSVARSQNQALFRNQLNATSASNAWTSINDALTQLQQTVGDTADEASPAAKLGSLKDALTAYAVSPGSSDLARAAVQAAQNLSTSLNEASAVVQTVRQDADTGISNAVDQMNSLLAQFKSLNDKVVNGTTAGLDVTDYVDQRDQVASQLSQYVGVSMKTRGNNDAVLYTDSGVTLFETVPRGVSFTKTAPLVPGQDGNAVTIDGVQVTGAQATMPIQSGSIFGLMQVRDDIATTYQSQIDQIAAGLIDATSEVDASGNTISGLFVSNVAGETAANYSVTGLAGRITVPKSLFSDPTPLRDGVNGQYNTDNAAGFADRINSILDALGQTRTYDGAAGIETSASLSNFAASSVGWLQAQRANAGDQADYQSTVLTRTQEALSDATGINLDEELTKLLELEHSYQASAKLMSTVGEMLDNLLNSVR